MHLKLPQSHTHRNLVVPNIKHKEKVIWFVLFLHVKIINYASKSNWSQYNMNLNIFCMLAFLLIIISDIFLSGPLF